MAASDPQPRSDRLSSREFECLTPAALRERLEEEISRAERYGIRLSCLLVVIENLDEMAREHGGELREQTVDYVAGALRRELRRFDRVGRIGRIGQIGPVGHDSGLDLLIILPGTDGPRGEIVARRALERMRAIKVEAGGARQQLEISVGLAAWRADVSAETLLAQARAAMRAVNGDQNPIHGPPPDAAAHAQRPTPASAEPADGGGSPPALGRAGGP
jgi:GGDEF domain-containing protein